MEKKNTTTFKAHPLQHDTAHASRAATEAGSLSTEHCSIMEEENLHSANMQNPDIPGAFLFLSHCVQGRQRIQNTTDN